MASRHRHPKPPCPQCGGTDTIVLTGRPKYLCIDGKDVAPPRRLLQCRSCHCEYDAWVYVRIVTATAYARTT